MAVTTEYSPNLSPSDAERRENTPQPKTYTFFNEIKTPNTMPWFLEHEYLPREMEGNESFFLKKQTKTKLNLFFVSKATSQCALFQ